MSWLKQRGSGGATFGALLFGCALLALAAFHADALDFRLLAASAGAGLIVLAGYLAKCARSYSGVIFEYGADFCCVVTREGKIVSVNQQAAGLFQTGMGELLGQSILDFFEDEDRDRARAIFQELALFDQHLEFEACTHRSGGDRWVSWAGSCHPKTREILLCGRDVTFRKVATDELFESEGRYRMVVDNAKEIIFRRDSQGRWLFLNQAWEDLTGFPVEDTLGKHYMDFVHPEDLARRAKYDDSLISERRQLGRQEVRCLCADGSFRWVEATFRMQYDTAGNLVDTVGAMMDISERKAADQALRREKDFTSTIIETVGALVVVLDSEGRIVRFNHACEQATGYSFEEVQGKHYWDYVLPPERVEEAKSVFATLTADMFPCHFENYWMHRDGRLLLIEWSDTCMTNPDGSIDYLLGTGKDVTLDRATRAELKTSQERYELAVLGSSDGLWDWDMVRNEFYYSPRWKEMLGYAMDELPSTPSTFDGLIHPDDAERVETALQAYLDQKTDVYKTEFRMRHKSGAYRWILARGIALRGSDGKPYRMAGSHSDITDDKCWEEAIRTSEIRLAEAQRLARIGSWESDLNGEEVYWSEEMFRLFDLEPSPSPPTTAEYRSMIHPEDLPKVVACIGRTLETGEPYEVDQRVILRDGSIRHIAAKGCLLRDEDGRPIKLAGTLQDVTERKHAEEELVRAREAALESARLKSEFLANMSHEIRTPMNGVIGMAELLAETSMDEEQKGYANTIQQCADSLLTILNDILDFSKIEAGKMLLQDEPFELQALLTEVSDFHKPAAERKHLRFEVVTSDGLAEAYAGDRLRLRQILANLLGNAVKFTESGSVVLKVSPAKLGLRFEAVDSGIGIAADRLNSIFESFTQADGSTTRRYGGTGLGLSIVRQLVDLMDGTMGVESKPGEGSTFWVEVPLKPASAAEIWRGRAREERVLKQPMRILLAEDNEVNRKVALKNLIRFGATVEIATTGLQALEMALADRYDLIIMDVQMPEMDGLEAVRRIRDAEASMGRRTRVVAMTAHAMKGDRERCLEAGMDDYISKPVQSDRLWEVLEMGQQESNEKVFDSAHLQDLSGGDTEFERDIVDTFLETAPEMIAELERALTDGQADLALRMAHTLKGSGRSIGANDFAMACQHAEEALRNGTTPDISLLRPRLEKLRQVTASHFSDKAA